MDVGGFFFILKLLFWLLRRIIAQQIVSPGRGEKNGGKNIFIRLKWNWNHSCKCCKQQFIRRAHNATPTICHAASPCCIWMRNTAWQWAGPLAVSSRKISAVRWRRGSCQILAKQGSWQILFVITQQIRCQMWFNWVTSCPRSPRFMHISAGSAPNSRGNK